MSQVTISGNASGTGIFTIASPNSNNTRTLTLPDQTGTLAITTDIPATPPADVQTFDATGTWTKPTGGQTMARVQVWGGGGGASRDTTAAQNYGGGGGGYNETIVPLSTLAGTITATVAAGGAGRTASTGAGTVGGTSTFGTVNAYGGAGAGTGSAMLPAPGGGQISAGTVPTSTTFVPGRPRTQILYVNDRGCPTTYPMIPIAFSWNGGNGAVSSTVTAQDALFGGAGGAIGNTAGSQGQSVYGGGGGAPNTVGTQPAGGGGGSSAANGNGSNGAAGRIVVTSW